MTTTMYWCDLCGIELCCGELCYRLGATRLCQDCLARWARSHYAWALELVQ